LKVWLNLFERLKVWLNLFERLKVWLNLSTFIKSRAKVFGSTFLKGGKGGKGGIIKMKPNT